MTYCDNWSGFLQEARSIFFGHPLKTRYSVKHVKGDKLIVLKVTDDRKCCKFKLSIAGHLRQLQQLNQLFLTWSVSRNLQSVEDLPLKVTSATSKAGKKPSSRRV